MNQISPLQQQFPLSPKKFLKKMIEKLGALHVLFYLFIVIDLIVIFMTSDTYNSEAKMILWGVLIVAILFLALVTFLYGWYVKVYIRRYYFAGEDNFITIKKGVFAPAEIHVQWQKIQDVYVDQDILDRIMGLYDVHIASATAASSIEAHIDGVEEYAAEGLKKFLLEKVSGAGKSFTQNVDASKQSIPSQNTADGVPQNVPQNISKVNLSEEISSARYPLLGKWIGISLFNRFIGSLIFPTIMVIIIFSKSDSSSYVDYWSYYLLGWVALCLLLMIVQIVTLFLWKKNYSFNFTPEYIFFREGVISISEKHMPYSSIQDVTVRQGVIERLFGLAKVVIENAAQQTAPVGRNGQNVAVFSGIMIQGISVGDANKITDILKTTVLGRNSAKHGL